MKKVLLTLLAVFMVTSVITGCTSENNGTVSNNPVQEDNKELSGFIKSNINCDALKDIIDYDGSLFITTNGDLYRIALYTDKVFSNGTHCKKVESDKKFIKFIKSGILDSQNDIYYYDYDNEEIEKYDMSLDKITMPNAMIDKLPKDKYKNTIYSEIVERYLDRVSPYFYYDDTTKFVYNYLLDLSDVNEIPVLKLSDDEQIEYITDGGIKTNKAIYVYGEHILNKSECDKYIDVKCEKKYEFYAIDDERITSQIEHIKFAWFYNSSSYIIVDDNNNVYVFLK